MHRLLIGLGMTGAAAVLVLVGSAQAEGYRGPPPKGWEGGFQFPYIICDTKDQIRAISEAGATSNGDLQMKFDELYQVKDDKDEPTCVVGPIKDVVIEESEDVGFSTDLAGVKVKAWAVHFGYGAGQWWMLYAERSEEASPSDALKRSATRKNTARLTNLCEGRSVSSYDPGTHIRTFWCS
jgi:hypothetical protein